MATKKPAAVSAFAAFKNNRQNLTEKLGKELERLNQNGPEKDARYWSPTVDKSGNGYAIIRFLPAAEGEDVPFVRMFSHAFKDAGGWYIENSLTTIGKEDPVSESNRELWATGDEENKKIVRRRKRKLSYISNIEVVKDAANPDAEGKQFLYKYGKKIWDKIADAMAGMPEEDVKGFNPFDLWEGANFKLRIRMVENFRNYDKSEFDAPAPLHKDDDKLEASWKGCHLLQPEISAEKFKTYEELEQRFKNAIGEGRTTAPKGPTVSAPEPRRTEAAKKPAADIHEEGDGFEGEEGDDADLARFRAMAQDE